MCNSGLPEQLDRKRCEQGLTASMIKSLLAHLAVVAGQVSGCSSNLVASNWHWLSVGIHLEPPPKGSCNPKAVRGVVWETPAPPLQTQEPLGCDVSHGSTDRPHIPAKVLTTSPVTTPHIPPPAEVPQLSHDRFWPGALSCKSWGSWGR